MRDIVIVASAFVVVLLAFLWWDQRRANKRWLKSHPRDWRGSSLRDPKADKAFPPKRYEYPKRKGGRVK